MGLSLQGVKRIKYERVGTWPVPNTMPSCWPICARALAWISPVEIGAINYVNDWVNVKVYYDARPARRRHYSEEVDLTATRIDARNPHGQRTAPTVVAHRGRPLCGKVGWILNCSSSRVRRSDDFSR